MESKKAKAITVTVTNPPDRGISLDVYPESGAPESWKFGDRWEDAAKDACLHAVRSDMTRFCLAFDIGEEDVPPIWVEVPPNFMKGDRIRGYPMLQVERLLDRRGFVCSQVSKGLWLVHRPDPRKGYSRRGYFDSVTTIRLATGDAGRVDEAIADFAASRTSSPTNRYLAMGGSMATKKSDADKAEEQVKEKLTVRNLEGEDVEVSPKQKELYDAIKARSASDAPVGSDEERLDDPSSIAAMKLATEKKAVLRYKPGKRWLYFATQKDLDKHQAAAEKAAAAAAPKKRTAASAGGEGGSDSDAAAQGKTKSGPIPKPGGKKKG
jgi:hypothetical protein